MRSKPISMSNKCYCISCKIRFNRNVADLRPRLCDDCLEKFPPIYEEPKKKKGNDEN
jgi:hypothetical protein